MTEHTRARLSRAAVPLMFLLLSAFLAVSAIVARARHNMAEVPGQSTVTAILRVGGEDGQALIGEVVSRMARDTALTASLIIPVIAGLGLNFGIVVGAMAGQMGLILATNFDCEGARGLVLAATVALPLAAVFGLLVAMLFNRAKGREMITGMIAGFFANGLYQLVFRFLAGSLLPIRKASMLLSEGVGMTNTVDLGGMARALDVFWQRHSMVHVVLAAPLVALLAGPLIRRFARPYLPPASQDAAAPVLGLLGAFALDRLLTQVAPSTPLSTFVAIGYLCLAVHFLLGTKLGQDCRAIGQDMHIAAVAGIQVDRVRTIAVVLSTVLAALGQIVFLQNMGTINTYNSHEQVGMFAVAALLIGGASVHSATLAHAIVGTFLFHTLFYVSPIAGREVLGNPQIGEYFRSFVAYGVIAMALAMHAARARREAKGG